MDQPSEVRTAIRGRLHGLRSGDGRGWAGKLPGESSGRERDRPGQSPADRRPFRRALRRGDPQPARDRGRNREGAGGGDPGSPADLDCQQRLQRRDDVLVPLRAHPSPGDNAGGQIRQPGCADPGERSLRADAGNHRLRLQTGRQDRPQDGNAEGSAIADSRRASLQRAGRAR